MIDSILYLTNSFINIKVNNMLIQCYETQVRI